MYSLFVLRFSKNHLKLVPEMFLPGKKDVSLVGCLFVVPLPSLGKENIIIRFALGSMSDLMPQILFVFS